LAELSAPADVDGVLITRPEPGASETAVRVAAMGLRPILAPVLAIRTLPPRLPAPEAVQAVLVSSGNALAALAAEWHDHPLIAVGNKTAERARRAGFKHVESADGDAEALVALVKRLLSPRGKPLLLPTARRQGTALAAALRAAGFSVVRRAVYEQAPATELPDAAVQALRAGAVRAALFFSAETARSFVRLVRRAGVADKIVAVEAVSIGQPASMALSPLSWRRMRVAERPNQEQMLLLVR
jgi:uroporphyrinogen-III synthase